MPQQSLQVEHISAVSQEHNGSRMSQCMRGAPDTFDTGPFTIFHHQLLDSVLGQRPAVLGEKDKVAPGVSRLGAVSVDIIPQNTLTRFANRDQALFPALPEDF